MVPDPEPLVLLDVEWEIHQFDGGAKFCVGAKGYEALSLNMAEILRYVTESKSVLQYYRNRDAK